MNYTVVQFDDELGWFTSDFTSEGELLAWAEVRGFKLIGVNKNHRQRAELQGAPILSGLCGPMWDGDAIRYENQPAYNRLSA